MSFLNWVLLGGVLAFTAPLIIHLLNRTRFKVVEWGAMHLLDAALQVNSQRIQWQSLLLLLLRCLIPILLALGLARPVLTNWRSAGGAGDKSLVILIDNSISMQALTSSGITRFEQAIQQAQEVIKQQAPSAELSVWSIGGQPVDLLQGTTFDHSRVANRLASLSSGAGSVAVQRSLASALTQVSSMQNASREIIVISDFQDHDWKKFSESERAAFKQQLAAGTLPVQLTLLPVQPPIAKANLSVEIEPLEQPLVVIDQVFRIFVKVRNLGDQPTENVPIILQVAGSEVASRRVTVPPNGATQAVFDCQIASPGSHIVNATIEDTKGLAGDNTSDRIVKVRNPLQVLIVDKQSSAPELQRATGYLSLALSPFQASDSGKNFMLTRIIHPDQLTKNEIADHDVLVIGDSQRLNDKVADEVAAFVKQGGGLLLFSPSSIDRNWYNSHWGNASKTPLLPADYLQDTKPLPIVAHVSEQLSSHASLAFFKQLGNEDFSSLEIKNAVGLKLNSNGDSVESGTHVLLKLDSAEPLVITKPYGEGNVLQFATSADTVDTNLPLRPIYVPLMQSLVQWLAIGTDSISNTYSGQSLTFKSIQKTTEQKSAAADKLATVTLPDRSRIEEKLDPQGLLTFSQTAFPGVYSVVIGTAAISSVVNGKKPDDSKLLQFENYAVSAPLEESELEFLTQLQLNELASATGASLATDAQELLKMQSLRANGHEVWRWFLLALVAFLFIELWWQQRITRGPL